MERLQNPFSLYDFLGYLIPGATGVYAILFIMAPSGMEWQQTFNYYNLNSTEMYFPLIVGSYIAGHIISFLSSVSIEKYSVWSVGYPSKYLLGIKTKGYWKSIFKKSKNLREKIVKGLSRIGMGLLLFPISFCDILFGRFFCCRFIYVRELDEFTKQTVRTHIDKNFQKLTEISTPEQTGEASDQNFFRVIYHYCLERVKSHRIKFQNYIALYGFLRALSFLFLILFWSLLLLDDSNHKLIYTLIAGIASYITYMGYNKFSRRFTLEVLMAFISLEEPSHSGYDYNEGVFTNWA